MEEVQKEQNEAVDFGDLDQVLKISIEDLQKTHKDRNERLRVVQKEIQLIQINQKKLPEFLEQAKALTKEINLCARSFDKLGVLREEMDTLRTEIQNVLIAMEQYGEKIVDVKLLNTVRMHRERLQSAIKIIS